MRVPTILDTLVESFLRTFTPNVIKYIYDFKSKELKYIYIYEIKCSNRKGTFKTKNYYFLNRKRCTHQYG